MGNLKEIRIRIASVTSTQKITGAMKLVSAAKLRRAQMSILSLRPYSNKLSEILQNLSSSIDSIENMPLFEARKPENIVIIAITSNRGLCGSFNSNIVKEVIHTVEVKYPEQLKAGNVKIICFGKKGFEQLKKHFEIILSNESFLESPDFSEIAKVSEKLMNEFIAKKIDKVDIVYNQFINPATQRIIVEDYLPVTNIGQSGSKKMNTNYIFEPSKSQLLEELIPKIIKVQLYKTIIDSIASEHGARMTSMSKATDNANEILKELKLKYNNARQSSITNELIEIVSGANALDG
jgi:F-type H+-transporting ATPase subunit gamma